LFPHFPADMNCPQESAMQQKMEGHMSSRTNEYGVRRNENEDTLFDPPSFDSSMDLENAIFMDQLRQTYATGFVPELDSWIGKDKA
jgi:hypothetical protein